MMSRTLICQEFSIVLAAKNHNPSLLNLDFLKYSGILDKELELSRSPIYRQQFAQLIFQNGISLTAQPERVTFIELMANKQSNEIKIPDIAARYIQILSQANYQAIGLNFTGYVRYDNSADAAYQYICNSLLSPGKWQDFGEKPVKASVNYGYTLKQGQLNLSVNEATIQMPEQSSVPAILFTGNFNYQLNNPVPEERQESLINALTNWKNDLETFQTLINEQFLDRETVQSSDRSNVLSLSASA